MRRWGLREGHISAHSNIATIEQQQHEFLSKTMKATIISHEK